MRQYYLCWSHYTRLYQATKDSSSYMVPIITDVPPINLQTVESRTERCKRLLTLENGKDDCYFISYWRLEAHTNIKETVHQFCHHFLSSVGHTKKRPFEKCLCFLSPNIGSQSSSKYIDLCSTEERKFGIGVWVNDHLNYYFLVWTMPWRFNLLKKIPCLKVFNRIVFI